MGKSILFFIGGLIVFVVFTLRQRENHEEAKAPAPIPTISQVPERSQPQSLQDKLHGQTSRFAELKKLYYARQYRKALVELYRQLSQVDPKSNDYRWLQDQEEAIVVSLAFQEINTGNCEEATTLLETIRYKVADSSKVWVGLALCAAKQNQFPLAISYLKPYLTEHPDDFQFVLLYASYKELYGEYEEALEQLNLLSETELSPEQKDRLQKTKKKLQARQEEAGYQAEIGSTHFSILYRPAQHDPLMDQVIELLETTLLEFTTEFGMPTPIDKILVEVYTPENFKTTTAGPSWAAGYFDGKIRMPIPPATTHLRQQTIRVFRHELFHALVFASGKQRAIASWLNEGLAMFLECPNGCRSSQPCPVSGKLVTPISRLRTPFTRLNAQEALAAYNDSANLVRMIDVIGNRAYENPVRQVIEAVFFGSSAPLGAIDLNLESLYSETQKVLASRTDCH